MKKMPKWVDVYPQGTKEGDEEQKFFVSIARNKKWKYRSVNAITKDTGLTVEQVERIINKYANMGLISPNPNIDGQWGYWERLEVEDDKSIDDMDKDNRIANS